MFVEGRLEGYVPHLAAQKPLWCEALHFGHDAERLKIRRAKQFQGTSRAPALAKSGAFEHNCPGIRPRHVEVRRIGTGVYPDALRRPAKAGASVWRPASRSEE